MAVVDTESRLESLIRDQLVPQLARMDERLKAFEKRMEERLAGSEKRMEERLADSEKRMEERLAVSEKRSAEGLVAVEKRLDDRLIRVEQNIVELAKAMTVLQAEIRERPRTATVVGIVISTVIGVVGPVIGTIALAPYLPP